MRAGSVAVGLLLLGCATAPVPPAPAPVAPPVLSQEPVRGAAERFLAVAEAARFDELLPLLAAPLRARYTPERLRADFAAEPLAGERLRRLRTALQGAYVQEGSRAWFPLGEGRAFLLEREGDAWRVAALE